MNKILRTACAFFIALALAAGVAPTLAEDKDEIVLKNPGFEEATENENPGWSYMKNADITIDSTRAKSGKNSLKINNKDNSDPWAAQAFTGFLPGAMYELGAWFNTDLQDLTGRGVGFKIEQYTKDNQYINGADLSGEKLNINTNGQWNYHSIFFQAHENAAEIKVYLRSYTPGKVWYDDVTVKLSGGPEPYKFYSDHVFVYPDETECYAEVRLDTYYKEDSDEAAATADFAIYDGAEKLQSEDNVTFSDYRARFTFNPQNVLKEKKKQYVLTCILKNKKGEEVGKWHQNLYVYDRPEMMPENGKFIVDGKPFYPVIPYHASYTSFPAIKEGGFNVGWFAMGCLVNEEQFNNTLAALEKNSLKGLVCLYADMKPAGHPKNIELTKKMITKLRDNPNVFAWAVMDEPLGAGVTDEKKQWLEDSYRIIRDMDPVHPVYLLDYANHEETIKYCDVFVADVYCHRDSAYSVSSIIEPLTKNHPRVSTYELAATYKQNGLFPKINTIRASVYRGIAAEHSYGTGCYSIDDAIGHDAGDVKTPLFDLEIWDDYCTINNVEVPILFRYYGRDEGIVPFNSERKGDLYREALWNTWFDGDDMYLMAHNRGADAVNFEIPLTSANGKIRVGDYKAEPVGLTKTGEKSGSGSISFSLGQEEAALYKITPSEKTDLSKINDARFDDLQGDYAWCADAVAELQAWGIVNEKSEGVFAPGEAIRRGDLAMFLVRTLGLTGKGEDGFSDVSKDAYYAKDIAIGKENGILLGVGDNSFMPEAEITRQDVMTICARGMKKAEKLAEGDASVLEAFRDKDNIADYARDSVASIVASGIIKGDDAGYINPLGNTRRAEAAVIMQRIKNAKKAEAAKPTPSEPQKEVITFSGAPSEEELIKWKRSAETLEGLGAAKLDIEKSITDIEANAVLSKLLGFEYTGFGNLGKAVTKAAAAETLVSFLGYDVYKERDGGALNTAGRLELFKYIQGTEDHLRAGEFALMIENALSVKLLDRTSFGEGSNDSYTESEDTILTRYMHLTLYKGILTNNTDSSELPDNQVTIDNILLEKGKTNAQAFIGQRVEAYAESSDNIIRYIRPSKSTEVITVNANDINLGETNLTRLAWDDKDGKILSRTISGAKLILNGKYKDNFDVSTITPGMGTVTLISNGGMGVDYIIVFSYNNYVVDSVNADDGIIRFKNHADITWVPESSREKLYLTDDKGENVDAASLKKWNILSISESEDGKVKHAVVSAATSEGSLMEKGTATIQIDDKTYNVADNMYGTPEFNKKLTYCFDFMSNVVAVNSDKDVKNYAYFTSIAKKKGIEGKIEMRVFTKDGEMKIIEVADSVRFNSVATPSEQLLENRTLVRNGVMQGQLIIMEEAGGKIIAFETADDADNYPSEEERWNHFTLDLETENNTAKRIFDGHTYNAIASKYFVKDNTVLFVVPDEYSENVNDYAVRGLGSMKHGDKFPNTSLYDVDENFYIGAMVQKKANIVDVGTSGTTAVVKSIGRALNADGESVTAVTLQERDEITLYFPSDDFKILFGSKVLTDIRKGETQFDTKTTGMISNQTLREYILPSALNVGDVVMYQIKQGSSTDISGMRVLMRAGTASYGEKSQEGMGEFYNYSNLTYAYSPVLRVIEKGVLIKPTEYERVYVFGGNGAEAPILLVKDGKVKKISKESIQKGDKIYVQKCNPYCTIMVVYR